MDFVVAEVSRTDSWVVLAVENCAKCAGGGVVCGWARFCSGGGDFVLTGLTQKLGKKIKRLFMINLNFP